MQQIIVIRPIRLEGLAIEKTPIRGNSKKVSPDTSINNHYHLWKPSLEKDFQLELALQFGSMFKIQRYIVPMCEME
jgi:hypothetical protein